MIELGPDHARRIDDALAREWLVANGLGGYASATVPGMPTRRYHGLLVVARRPPLDRAVLVTQCEEMLVYGGRAYQISTTEYVDGTLSPAGHVHLQTFRLERGLPVAGYEIGDTTLEKQTWMAHGRDTTYIRYRLAPTAVGSAELRLQPLLSGRPYHQLWAGGQGAAPPLQADLHGCTVTLGEPPLALRLHLTDGWFEQQPDWYWRVLYRRERERGLEFSEDLFTPGTLAVTLPPGGTATLIVTSEPPGRVELDPEVAWRLEWRRRGDLEQRARAAPDDTLTRAMVLAADALIVAPAAAPAAPPVRRTILAGYHWFAESTRDTLIALPGLTLVTGRHAEARAILTRLLADRREGLLPAHHDEATGQISHASVDATLWFLVALRAYLRATGDRTLLTEAWPALVDSIERYTRGTLFGIRVDPVDGLLSAGETGYQLTWMDAQAGEWVVTPRRGKPVEVNALWYNALRQMSEWAAGLAPEAAQTYRWAAERVEGSFNRRFWYAPGGYLYDVIDTDAGDDRAFRPNQVLAIGLPFPVLARDRWRPVLDAVTDRLLTPYGLRTLSPGEPHYAGWYAGDVVHRDSAYHQGTVWPWLLGPYSDARQRVHGSREGLREHLRVLEKQVSSAGLGYISEIYDGDTPHSPQGAIVKAPNIGEVLRVWRLLNGAWPEDDTDAPARE